MDEKTEQFKKGVNQLLENVEASGTIEVFDKEGKLKFTQQITSIKVKPEDQDNAT